MLIDGINYFVEDLGDRSKDTAVVFLNGVMASTNSWYAYSQLFVDLGFRVVLHDFKGQLKSDKPAGPYTFSEHASETMAILKELGIKKAHFIGTSYGGEVALNIGFRYPDFPLSLTIINSVSELDERLKLMIESWIALAKNKDGETFFWGMASTIYGTKFLREEHAFLAKRAIATKKVASSYFDGQISLYETFNNDVYMTDKLHLVKAPTLIIGSDEDILKPLKFCRIMHQEIKHSEFVILEGIGHVSIFEAVEALKTLMLGFVVKNQ